MHVFLVLVLWTKLVVSTSSGSDRRLLCGCSKCGAEYECLHHIMDRTP